MLNANLHIGPLEKYHSKSQQIQNVTILMLQLSGFWYWTTQYWQHQKWLWRLWRFKAFEFDDWRPNLIVSIRPSNLNWSTKEASNFDNADASTHLLLGKLAFPHFPPKCKMFSCCDALKVYGIDSLHERYPKHRRKWMPGAKALPKMFQKLKILQIKPSGGFQMGGK